MANNSAPLALDLNNVTKTFGATTAVKGLTLQVKQGEVLAFLGPNGAGKTTTIEMCEGFQTPTSGSIRVLGLDPTREADKLRERVGIMLQGGGSYSGVRVEEMLKLTASYCEHPLSPDWLIELLGLQGVRHTTYRRLSGGQQQRLSLALALIGRPELVFLDEATAGMDAQSRLVVWNLVKQLKRDGVTVVLTTHLMDEAQALADTVVIIDHGELIAQGTPEEFQMDTSGQSATRLETASALDLEALPATLRDAISETRPLHYRLVGAPDPEVFAALAQQAAEQRVLITKMETTTRTLEDAFLDLTGRHLRS